MQGNGPSAWPGRTHHVRDSVPPAVKGADCGQLALLGPCEVYGEVVPVALRPCIALLIPYLQGLGA